MNISPSTILSLIDSLETEVVSLKENVRRLEDENAQLKDELETLKSKQPEVFDSLSSSQRLALKQRVQFLIDKIDSQLNEKN